MVVRAVAVRGRWMWDWRTGEWVVRHAREEVAPFEPIAMKGGWPFLRVEISFVEKSEEDGRAR